MVSFFFALLAAAGVQSQWEEWLLFVNRQDFGITDPQFGTDIGFYLFQLPFLTYVVDWAFAVLIIIFILTVIAHYLNGGIRMAATSGERTTASVKVHLSAILAVLAVIRCRLLVAALRTHRLRRGWSTVRSTPTSMRSCLRSIC